MTKLKFEHYALSLDRDLTTQYKDTFTLTIALSPTRRQIRFILTLKPILAAPAPVLA